VSGFSSDWLALREAADRAARDPGLMARLADWAAGRRLRVVDLGCGTGATWRALSPHLPGAEWLLVDHDPALLQEAARRTGAKTRRADLARDIASVLAGADIVTASALFDLCSRKWVDQFVAALPAPAAVYGALSYDGREVWRPAHPLEDRALAAFHSHQYGDKGFGLSLGPAAAAHLAMRLEASGRTVATARSDWRLGPEDRPLIAALADGAAEAVAETGALKEAELTDWRAARRAAQSVEIGHLDILALPAP
jgi:SAM-dependent methyltransferase